jgi:membrane-associated protease RseP (regulator of RpoE activity)
MPMPAYAWSLIFLGYLVILLAHEAGHLLVARWYGYPVTELSIGFGDVPLIVELGGTSVAG